MLRFVLNPNASSSFNRIPTLAVGYSSTADVATHVIKFTVHPSRLGSPEKLARTVMQLELINDFFATVPEEKQHLLVRYFSEARLLLTRTVDEHHPITDIIVQLREKTDEVLTAIRFFALAKEFCATVNVPIAVPLAEYRAATEVFSAEDYRSLVLLALVGKLLTPIWAELRVMSVQLAPPNWTIKREMTGNDDTALHYCALLLDSWWRRLPSLEAIYRKIDDVTRQMIPAILEHQHGPLSENDRKFSHSGNSLPDLIDYVRNALLVKYLVKYDPRPEGVDIGVYTKIVLNKTTAAVLRQEYIKAK